MFGLTDKEKQWISEVDDGDEVVVEKQGYIFFGHRRMIKTVTRSTDASIWIGDDRYRRDTSFIVSGGKKWRIIEPTKKLRDEIERIQLIERLSKFINRETSKESHQEGFCLYRLREAVDILEERR